MNEHEQPTFVANGGMSGELHDGDPESPPERRNENKTVESKTTVEMSVKSHGGDPKSPPVVIVDGDVKIEENPKSSESESPQPVKFENCQVCKKECKKGVRRCKSCKGGLYCSRKCRKNHEEKHKELCHYIVELEKLEESKRIINKLSVREENQVKLKLKNSLVKLVGEKPMLKCNLNGKKCEALWDTGAMVSMGDREWITETDPDCEILTVEQFLEGDNLHLYAANNTKVDIEGIAMVKFGLGPVEIPVPFLITKEKLESPIIGYNLIKHLVQMGIEELPSLLKESIPLLSESKAEAVISLIHTDNLDEHEVVTSNKTVIPANSKCRIKCRTKFEVSQPTQNLVFTANPTDQEFEVSDSVVLMKLGKRSVNVVVSNPTNSPITLAKGYTLGAVESVSAIIPISPAENVPSEEKNHTSSPESPAEPVSKVNINKVEAKTTPMFDLSHLSDEHREIAENCWRRKETSFVVAQMIKEMPQTW